MIPNRKDIGLENVAMLSLKVSLKSPRFRFGKNVVYPMKIKEFQIINFVLGKKKVGSNNKSKKPESTGSDSAHINSGSLLLKV